MSKPLVIKSQKDFDSLLKDLDRTFPERKIGKVEVMVPVTIKSCTADSFVLEDFDFFESVEFHGVSSDMFEIKKSLFRGGLSFHGCHFNGPAIRACGFKSLAFERCKFIVLTLDDIFYSGNPRHSCSVINISGVEVSRNVLLQSVRVERLVLATRAGDMRFKAPLVYCDNPAQAHQLHLFGINVYVETRVAELMLKDGQT